MTFPVCFPNDHTSSNLQGSHVGICHLFHTVTNNQSRTTCGMAKCKLTAVKLTSIWKEYDLKQLATYIYIPRVKQACSCHK